MNLTSNMNKIKELISRNETQKAFIELKKTITSGNEFYNRLIILESQFNRVLEAKRLNIANVNDIEIQINKTNLELLNLLDDFSIHNKKTRLEVIFVIETDIENNQDKILNGIISKIIMLCNDNSIKLLRIEKGSTILFLEMSNYGYHELQNIGIDVLSMMIGYSIVLMTDNRDMVYQFKNKKVAGSYIVEEAADLVEMELEDDTNMRIEVYESSSTSIVELLDIESRIEIPIDVRNKLLNLQGRIIEIILRAAIKFESEQLKNNELRLNVLKGQATSYKFLNEIIDNHKRVSFSITKFQISVNIYLSLLERIKIKNSDIRVKDSHISRYKHVIMVYTLFDSLIKSIKNYKIDGDVDLLKIKKMIFDDFQEWEKSENVLLGKVKLLESEIKSQLLERINNRKAILLNMKEKWNELEMKILFVKNQMGKFKNLIPDFEVYKEDFKNQIDLLSSVSSFHIVDRNIQLIKEINTKDWETITPFTIEEYSKLLGLNS